MSVPAFTKRISERNTCLECECLHLVDGVLSWIKWVAGENQMLTSICLSVLVFCALHRTFLL